jgi:hypothetical protein
MNTRYIAWLLIVAGFVFCRFSFLEEVVYNVDEAEYAVAADGLSAGWRPGVELLGSTKPPAIALLYAALFEFCGRSMRVLHIAHLVIAILAGVLVVELGALVLGAGSAIPTALAYVALANSFATPSETLALNVESPGMLAALAALCLGWRISRVRGLILCGILIGIGGSFRQSILLFALPLLFIPVGPAARVQRATNLAAGILLAWLPIFFWYGGSGDLSWAWDSWVRYPADYASDLGVRGYFEALAATFSEFIQQSGFALFFSLLGLGALFLLRAQSQARWLFGLTVVSFLALSAGSRFYGHYFYQFYPALALLAALAWRELQTRSMIARGGLVLCAAVALIVSLRHFPNWYARETWHPPRGVSYFRLTAEQLEFAVADYVRENTVEDERITVWGYCPQIYYLAGRLPGTRDYLCHYVTGYSPQSFDPLSQTAPRAAGHPRAEEMFVADLAARAPRFIIDLVRVTDYDFPFLNYSLLNYPQIRDYVRAHYQPDREMGDVVIYRRRITES